jgi:hypothetical protein
MLGKTARARRTLYINPVVAVARARGLSAAGWHVHVVDANGCIFYPEKFDHLLKFDPEPATLMRDPGNTSGRFFPAADIGSSLATNLACEKRLEIGQPDVIRPSVAADRCPMTLVIRVIDQETANVSGAHLGEGDLLLAAGARQGPRLRQPGWE